MCWYALVRRRRRFTITSDRPYHVVAIGASFAYRRPYSAATWAHVLLCGLTGGPKSTFPTSGGVHSTCQYRLATRTDDPEHKNGECRETGIQCIVIGHSDLQADMNMVKDHPQASSNHPSNGGS